MKKETIELGLSYTEYRTFIQELLAQGKTTGAIQSNELVGFTKLNEQRMNRNEKQFVFNERLKKCIINLTQPEIWVVFVEAWCGDCAQNVPILAKIADSSDNKILLYLLIKSEYTTEFQQYLTDGNESIPKLIRFDKETYKELGAWGARPEKAQNIAEHWKLHKDTISKDEFEKELHLWYAKDRGQELQLEIAQLLSTT
jgi:hypothetical protein